MGRTTATILFTDLVGSTELRGRLGEEAADELLRSHERLLTEAVEAHQGRVVKGLGDGIMATFTGASDGVAAGEAIQQAVERLNRTGKAPAPLGVRVGLSAGDVSLEDEDAHGTPVIEAARLCAAAGGGEILVSEVVRLLAGLGDGGLVDRGRLELKGLQQPVAAWAVGWEPAGASTIPMPALLADVGRVFVGRDGELERLGRLWKEAVAGERRVALLAGEPGIGKTRLASVAARRAHEEGSVVLAGRCDEDLGVPYQPFVEALRHHVVNVGSEARLGRYAGELVRLVPDVAEAMPGLPPPLRSDPETERYRLFDAVAAWLAAVSAEEPLLLVLDDLQWAAKPTLLLLRHVLRSAEGMSLLVVATYRDSDVGRGHPLAEFMADLRREQGVERMSLTGLDAAGVADYLVQAAGHDLDDAGQELARLVWRETEGSPFFVSEVMRHLAESGAVEQRDGRWVVTAALDELGIPEGVRDVVGRRLSRLSDEANRVLACASVCIRYDQGRLGEVVRLLRRATARDQHNPLTPGALAVALCELDQRAEAAAVFESVAADDFGALPRNVLWLYGLTVAAEACAWLGDRERATVLHERLAPHCGLIAGVGPTISGCVDHYVALLAAALGNLEEAEACFTASEGIHARLGAPTLLARTRLEWARMLLTRRQPADGGRARELLEQALATARELGLGGVERRAVALLEQT